MHAYLAPADSHPWPDVGQLAAWFGNRPHLELAPEHGRRHEDADQGDANAAQRAEQDRVWRVLEMSQADALHRLAHALEQAALGDRSRDTSEQTYVSPLLHA